MTDKECEELGKRIQVLAEQLDGFVWPEDAFEELQSIQTELNAIALELYEG